MVKVKILELRKTGAVAVTRSIQKNKLKEYRKVKFRGKITYAKLETILDIRRASRDLQPAGTLLPEPPATGEDFATETFTIRDDYPGGGLKRNSKGEVKGKNSKVKIEMSVTVKGNQDQRDRAFQRLQDSMTERFRFLRYRGRIGRSAGGKTEGGKAVEVQKTKINDRRSLALSREIFFELLDEVRQ